MSLTKSPYLAQSLFGHGVVPPFWCLHEWKAAADFAVACKHRPSSGRLKPGLPSVTSPQPRALVAQWWSTP